VADEAAMKGYCEDYKKFLDAAKTEREAVDEVVRLGSQYLLYMSVFYLWPAFTNGFQGFFRGIGKMYTTIYGTLIQITVRTVCTYFLAPAMGIVGIAFACMIGWSAMLLFEVPYYFYGFVRKQRKRKLFF